MKKTIGAILTELRGDRSQKEVAEAVGISLSALSSYERNERVPRDEKKMAIARYYKRDVGSIFFSR